MLKGQIPKMEILIPDKSRKMEHPKLVLMMLHQKQQRIPMKVNLMLMNRPQKKLDLMMPLLMVRLLERREPQRMKELRQKIPVPKMKDQKQNRMIP